ncbi:hypothetical protein HRR83_000965 [Exophiala dermatitidis]|uniref:Uncharacterized protein n=2 Tax=Exophiala dermatitidis TaxID=5970 RepID=H6CBQ8_EXODN|nr:uncharacterized protein HMPREF1120_09141 [Exophiala dermatitidis NIH/UT8656]KAJ4528214.1 hypothetical protein HRR74_000969 [Exophiala dermatitidis]EHY61205.1 hypothetical protein HMPREF1120_09141 [Exophiala dermatitidis NIH/UT8656]KAJ4528847.1 hypothetical protein HRR73_001470 [Exophiala dermatitidis]KAJ4530238.1 hypothetical protein HRR76_009466 [Exophiala dermatitidis]KAJ4559004.1 hypothetical protein HRR77_000968 [Exophiala dermatitidis]
MPFLRLVPEERAPYHPASMNQQPLSGEGAGGSQASKTSADTKSPAVTSSSGSGSGSGSASGTSDCKFLKLTPEPNKSAAVHVQRGTTADDEDKAAVESTAKQ